MAVDNFIYQGINRAISDYSGSRMCEELINMRPTEGGLVPIKPFKVKLGNVPYSRIYVHRTTDGNRYLAVKKGTGSVSVIPITINDESGTATEGSALFSISGIATGHEQDVIDNLHFAAAGNIVLFSACYQAATAANSVYGNWSFTWVDPTTGYTDTEADAPALNVTIDDGSASVTGMGAMHVANVDTVTRAEIADNVESALNALQESDPELCVGPTVIAIALKTKDGNTFWTDDFRVYDPVSKFGSSYPPTVFDNTSWWGVTVYGATYFDDFFDKYTFGYDVNRQGDVTVNDPELVLECTKVKVKVGPLSSTAGDPNYWNKDTSMIKSVEVYCSKPIPYVDPETAYDGKDPFGYPTLLAKRDYAKMDLDSVLLYHQASIPMERLLEGQQSVQLRFGGNVQTASETLRVDAGALKRYGRLLSYNARFHYFDSVSMTEVGIPRFSGLHAHAFSSSATYVFVRWTDESGNRLLYVDSISGAGYIGADLTIAPSVNITEVILYSKYTRDNHAMYSDYSCRVRPSSAYNYAIGTEADWTGTTGSGVKSEYEALITADPAPVIQTQETDAINVTEQYNPFVFRVEHSYKAPGNVIDVQPQMAGLTDASYGRDPLNVFTERGLYALTQGSADVLYGAFLPVSNLVGQRGGVPVEMGTFFLADGSLWLVSGRKVTLVSDALSLGPHKYVRACTGYKQISGVDEDYSPAPGVTPIYDASPYLSQVDFDTFSRGGRLGYNRFRMELFVSNPAYDYTYVLSLKHRQWFKLSQQLWQDEASSELANTLSPVTAGNMRVLDLANESLYSTVPLLIHMQSRPFSMGYQYSHIHRIVAMTRAMLASANNKLAAALYGSDDLQNWSLLAFAKRSGKTEYDPQSEELVDTPLYISQIRTSSSARSWRYYTVCLGGLIPVDADFHTDIGPVLVDYAPVVRRLG